MIKLRAFANTAIYITLRLSQEGVTGLNKQERWPEFVSDLWEEGELKLIKDSAKTYTTGIRNVANGTTTTATTSAEYGYDIEEEEEFTIDTQNDDSEELQHTASSDSTLQGILRGYECTCQQYRYTSQWH